MLAGIFMQSGLARMMSRVLAALYISDTGTLTAADLVKHLQISPATISKSIAFLESQELVRRERDERRRERYTVDNELWYQSTITSARANIRLAEIARQGVTVLGPGTPAAVRLESVARFTDYVGEAIIRAAEQSRDVLFTKAETAGSEQQNAARQSEPD
jgi:DNA-binding IclR family transcriptional regulator